MSLRAFNQAYYHRPLPAKAVVHYEPFFYPLDGVNRWNRIYGKAGFYQYQCVIPRDAGPGPMEEILRRSPMILVDDRLQGLTPFLQLDGSRPAPRPVPPAALPAPPAPPAVQQPTIRPGIAR